MRIKKIRYVPGLISLLGLPLLLIFFGPEEKQVYSSMKLFLPADQSPEQLEGMRYFDKQQVINSTKGKQIENIMIEGYMHIANDYDPYVQKRKLAFVQQEIERLAFSYDTSRVLKIKMDRTSSYGDFMYVLNMAVVYHCRRYAVVDDVIYIFANNPPIEYPEITLPLDPDLMILNLGPPPSRWQLFRREVDEKLLLMNWMLKPVYNKVLLVGFVLLIAAPAMVFMRRKRRLVNPGNMHCI
jgi:biopolymer transport protein ExbD